MSLINIIIIAFVAFISVYAIVDRICRCVEDTARSKAVATISANGVGAADKVIDEIIRCSNK